jgi:uncharacterized damage-inducible protein DinB
MSDRRAEEADLEAIGWNAFEGALRRIPQDRWAEEGVLPGWSVKELLWHVAGWIGRCADRLAEMRETTSEPVDETSGTQDGVDAMNAAFAAAARTMDPQAVWSGLVAARERVLATWRELADVDETAIGWFREETHEHYEEHRLDLERFAG